MTTKRHDDDRTVVEMIRDRFDGLDNRFDRLDTRLDHLDTTLETHFTADKAVEKRIVAIESEVTFVKRLSVGFSAVGAGVASLVAWATKP